jgi:hypothetical protein
MAIHDGNDFGFDYMPPPKRRRVWAKIIRSVFGVGALALAVLFVLVFDRVPVIEQETPPNADDVGRAKDIYRRIIRFTAPNSPDRSFELAAQELNSLFVVGSHARPSVRASASFFEDGLSIQGSVRVPFIPFMNWVNGRATLKASEQGLHLSDLRLGSIPIPAPMVMWLGQKVTDSLLRDRLGTQVVESIGKVQISAVSVKVETYLPSALRNQIAKRAKVAARGINDVSSTEVVHERIMALDAAVKSGVISPADSIVPFLAFTVRSVADKVTSGSEHNEAQAALLALAVYCGHQRFEDIVGDVMPPEIQNKPNGCVRAKLVNRIDLRLHLVVSAGLQTLGHSGSAFAVGEIKELLDSRAGGSGFSFDDLAADRAGIRFASRLLEATPDELTTLAANLDSEKDVFPSIDALPSGMSRQDFERIYKDVGSAAYEQLVAEIDERLDGVRFFKR